MPESTADAIKPVRVFVVPFTGGTAGPPMVLLMKFPTRGGRVGHWAVIDAEVRADETTALAAKRALREQARLEAEAYYVLDCLTLFDWRRDRTLAVPVIAARLAKSKPPRITARHEDFEWLLEPDARAFAMFPHERRILDELTAMLAEGFPSERHRELPSTAFEPPAEPNAG